jgi:PAS domain S-box-containing protein/putative nucleotidyltransferase with HDIG domain
MTRDQILYLIPYTASLTISIGVLIYTWSRRSARGAFAFAWYQLGQSLWVGAFIFELLSSDINNKIFWDGFQWLASFFMVIALPVFSVQYTEHTIRRSRALFALSLVVPVLFTITLFLDSTFHWIYADPSLTSAAPFPELLYDFTPVIYGYAAYVYAVTLWALYILIERIIHPHNLYRAQVTMITLGVCIPIFSTVFALFNIHITPERDAMPFTGAVGSLIIAWGLFRHQIFEVVPIARDRIFEAMVEPVVILDNKNLVVDINSSMLALLGKPSEDVIGKPAKEIFDDFPIPIKLYTQTSYARAEASFPLGGKAIHYELTVWPLFNANKEITSRIYISHDITALKELEQELRKLNSELEDRVRARTWELAEAYDTTLEGWARALELRDKETEGHSRRVTETTLKIAHAMKIPEDDMEHIRRGAILHDIGKMGIPDEILHKTGKLTADERKIINEHPITAYKLLSPIPFLKKALDIPYCHHEKWDGSGYPQGLKGSDIPLAARIFAIADVWDAITSNRPYNQAWSSEKAAAYFIEESGKHFDPVIVNVFLGLVEKGEI